MSFVFIENNGDSICKTDYWIKKTRNESKDEKITPDFAMQVLTKTNHSGHIKTILYNIGEKCASIKDRLEYKEFVLSAVDGREQTKEIKEYLRDLAVEAEYVKEFDEADGRDKFYGTKEINGSFVKINASNSNLLQQDARVKMLRANANLTPETAKEILEECGHHAIIKSLIKIIEEQGGGAEYKDFILACACGREVSPSLSEHLQKFATEHNFIDEFTKVNAKPKVYNVYGAKIDE